MEKTYKELKQELKDLRNEKLLEIIDSLPSEVNLKEHEVCYHYYHSDTILVADDSLTAKELCNQHDNFFNQYELNGLMSNKYDGIGRCHKIKQRHFIECNENGEVIGERITTRTNIYRSYYKI